MRTMNLAEWYQENKRDLPWRHTTNEYHVLLIEVMSQQTQISRVGKYLDRFTAQFPTLHDLANAEQKDVIIAWDGLGYNSRAVNLHKTAKVIMSKFHGKLPVTVNDMLTLPGIGPYTARSILVFTRNHHDVALDVNMRRVWTRRLHGHDGVVKDDVLREQLTTIMTDPQTFHAATMDFANMLCLPKPKCAQCPLQCRFKPVYQLHGENVLRKKVKKVEKGVTENGKHVPNRIFRGRVIKRLRESDQTFEQLTSVKKDYTENDEIWLVQLLQKLESENKIVIGDTVRLQ